MSRGGLKNRNAPAFAEARGAAEALGRAIDDGSVARETVRRTTEGGRQ